MICPRCGNPISLRFRSCENCGCDLTVFRRVVRISNGYYNRGLEKAKVRDLTGAVICLKRSLEIYKYNIDARNLLGLVYYEMGEPVAALSEWVISKHFRATDNPADYFMERVQDNPTELDTINQAVRKFNLALNAAREHNDDIAIIQLKKIISMYGNYMKAYKLIALLLIKNEDYDDARRYLNEAHAIDVGDTTVLRYLAEIDKVTGAEQPVPKGGYLKHGDDEDERENANFLSKAGGYREDKPNIMVFVNLLLGVIIGIVVVYYLIVPTMRSKIKEEYSSMTVDYSAELSSKTATITQNEKKIASLENKVSELTSELDAAKASTTVEYIDNGAEPYSAIFTVWNKYQTLRSDEYTDDELQTLALELWAIDLNGVDNEYALSLVEDMRGYIYPKAARKIYKAGKALYDSGDSEGAAGMLEAAVSFDPDSDSAMYYLGKALQDLERYEEAVYYYKLMLEVCPNSTLKQYIPQRLRECGAED